MSAKEALEAAAAAFAALDLCEWPQNERDAFYGDAGRCPVDYSEAQQKVREALKKR